MKILNYTPALFILLILAACSTTMKTIPTVEQVDLKRFMGDWYVIANIPTVFEQGAHNAVENYALNADGSIATTFSFNDGSFKGKHKQYHPTGFVSDTDSNASWVMQFLWPFKAEYKIIYLDDNYQQTIIGRSKRDYLWIMARTPEISPADYQALLKFAVSQGYDPDQIKQVPQQWGNPNKTTTPANQGE